MSDRILTEEELRFRESVFQDQYMGSVMSKKPYQYSQEIIASHRSLLSINAELSFKNQKYKELILEIKGHLSPEIHDDEEAYQLVRKINALEELK